MIFAPQHQPKIQGFFCSPQGTTSLNSALTTLELSLHRPLARHGLPFSRPRKGWAIAPAAVRQLINVCVLSSPLVEFVSLFSTSRLFETFGGACGVKNQLETQTDEVCLVPAPGYQLEFPCSKILRVGYRLHGLHLYDTFIMHFAPNIYYALFP